MLGAKQTALDSTIKAGKLLMDKSNNEDALTIEAKIADLKARWDAVCGLSVERYVLFIAYAVGIAIVFIGAVARLFKP